jgi:hypothetical protein
LYRYTVVLTLVTPDQRVAAVAAVQLMARTGGVAGHALLRGRLDEMLLLTPPRDLSGGGGVEDWSMPHQQAPKEEISSMETNDDDANTIAAILAAAVGRCTLTPPDP